MASRKVVAAVKVNGKPLTSIWIDASEPTVVCAIDQRLLPHQFLVAKISSVKQMHDAIKDMLVRGAPLIGVAAAYGVYLAAIHAGDANFHQDIEHACQFLQSARPTAVNLEWALRQQRQILADCRSKEQAVDALRANANKIRQQEIDIGKAIGEFGAELIEKLRSKNPNAPVQVLTHCNAGWLCTVDWGTATAPIYTAFNNKVGVHVWVDETRPRNQGAALTAWELGEHGVPYTVIADNTGGHLMQKAMVDLIIVGTDRLAGNGDAANKIGTYLKALAAHDNNIPFYVAAPSSSIDFDLTSGQNIPIEQRDIEEVKYATGRGDDGKIQRVLLTPENARAANYAFDVTPARLISGIITERGICPASQDGLRGLFPGRVGAVTS
jgi:methylthioribose-1-phosphate isomerase